MPLRIKQSKIRNLICKTMILDDFLKPQTFKFVQEIRDGDVLNTSNVPFLWGLGSTGGYPVPHKCASF